MEVGVSEETTVDEEDQEAVDKKKAEVDENASGKVLYVDLNPYARGDEADDRLGHAIDADWLVGEGVLEEADGGPGQCANDRITARDRKENRDDEREIKDRKPGKRPGKKGLQQDRAQWHQQRDCGREAVLLELSAGCIATGGHKDWIQ